jgi:hypothetical protein
MDQPWSQAAPLDDYLREVVVTLRQVTERGLRHIGDDSEQASQAIAQCTEILDVVLAGDVRAWLDA